MNHISQARMKVIDYYHLDVSRDDEFVQGWKFFEWELLLGGVVFDHMKDFGFLGHSNLDGVSGANSSKLDSTFLTSSIINQFDTSTYICPLVK
jgi:hypothetical protein